MKWKAPKSARRVANMLRTLGICWCKYCLVSSRVA